MAAGRLRVAGAETRVRPAYPRRRDGAVVAADPAADVVVGAAMVEQRGHVVRAHERQGQESPGRGGLAEASGPVLDRAIRNLARIRPARVLEGLVSWRQRGVRLRRQCRQNQRAEGEEEHNNPHSLENEVAHGRVALRTSRLRFG